MVIKNKSGKGLRRSGKIFAALAVLLCSFAGAAKAQQASGYAPRLELSGDYSYVRANGDNSNGGFNVHGGSASLAYNFSDRFSLVADGGAYRFRGLPSGLTSTMYTYLFGPRIALSGSGRIVPYAQVLVGGGQLNASSGGAQAGETGFAMAAGGGLDVPFHRHFAVRVVQAEYLLTRFSSVTGSSATQNNIRISAGLVIRFGSR